MKYNLYLVFCLFILFSCKERQLPKLNDDIMLESTISKSISANENYDYFDGNGTIVEEKIENNLKIIVRKHEDILKLFSVPSDGWYRVNDLLALDLLEKPELNSSIKYTLPEYPIVTHVDTILFRFEQNLVINKNSSWLYVKTNDGNEGWLYLGLNIDPYDNGIWSIDEIIETQDKKWTVRKLGGSLSIYQTVLDVYDIPDNNVLYQIIPTQEKPQLPLYILAITEEPAGVWNGRDDYWVKIKDEQNRIGWIFGGYASVERGGPKYMTPKSTIGFNYDFP